MLLIALAFAAVLALPSPATASYGPPSPAAAPFVSAQEVAPASKTLTRSLDAAYYRWSLLRVPVCPRDQVTIYRAVFTDELVGGLATTPGCQVWISSTTWLPAHGRGDAVDRAIARRVFCDVIMHELGHTGGLLHSETPGDIMSPTLASSSWRCRKAFPLPK